MPNYRNTFNKGAQSQDAYNYVVDELIKKAPIGYGIGKAAGKALATTGTAMMLGGAPASTSYLGQMGSWAAANGLQSVISDVSQGKNFQDTMWNAALNTAAGGFGGGNLKFLSEMLPQAGTIAYQQLANEYGPAVAGFVAQVAKALNPGAAEAAAYSKYPVTNKEAYDLEDDLSRIFQKNEFPKLTEKSNVPIVEGLREHVIRGENLPVASREIKGTHNKNEFERYLGDINVIKRVSSSKIKGVETIFYNVYKMDKTGATINEWKSNVYKKSIYDPSIINDEQFYQWGLEAANEALSRNMLNKEWTGIACNGIKYYGYTNVNGEVTSFLILVD